MLHADLAFSQVQARHRDFAVEAARERRLALARPAGPTAASALRRVVVGLGTRRPTLPPPTAASAAC